jgi:hypothetical protein
MSLINKPNRKSMPKMAIVEITVTTNTTQVKRRPSSRVGQVTFAISARVSLK